MPKPRKQSRIAAGPVNGHNGNGHHGNGHNGNGDHGNGHNGNGENGNGHNGNGHNGPRGGQVNGDDPGTPHIRLQDWEVIDKVTVGSTDYVILRRTRDQKSGVESLTPRERDAVRLACTGASNKDIAWTMGISDSTVGVLLLRARRKLKVAGRDELIRVFET